MSLRLSWAGSAARPGGAAGPAPASCVGPPGLADLLLADMRAFVHRSGLALADAYAQQPDGGMYQAMRAVIETATGGDVLFMSAKPGGAR